jgi:hypothetical protein
MEYFSATTKTLCTSGKMGDIPFANGTYMKSFCIINYNKNFSASITDCTSRGWILFQINSNQTQQALFAGLSNYFSGSGAIIYIDGKRDITNGKWYYVGSGSKIPAYSGLNWQNGVSKTPVGDDCMEVLITSGKWEIVGRNETRNNWSICEYQK